MKNFENKTLNYNEAKEKALKFLDFRSHSEKELKDKLKRAGAPDDIISDVIDFLNEYRLIDDTEYAKRYARDLQNLKRYGKNRIKSELVIKGIKSYIIDEVIAELPEQEENLLFELVKKRLKGDFEKKNCDRVMRYFIYRGYQPDEIKSCINDLKAELNEI